MTPDERREVVAMLRADANSDAIDAAKFNDEANHQAHCEVVGCRHGQGVPPDMEYAAECRDHAWHLAARANLLTLAADEIERAKETDDDR